MEEDSIEKDSVGEENTQEIEAKEDLDVKEVENNENCDNGEENKDIGEDNNDQVPDAEQHDATITNVGDELSGISFTLLCCH